LRAELDRLTGVYYEPDHDFGSMLHFVFRCRRLDRLDSVASSPEVSDVRYWPLDDLSTPISDFTERRSGASSAASGGSDRRGISGTLDSARLPAGPALGGNAPQE
jgi:hypothetical protein